MKKQIGNFSGKPSNASCQKKKKNKRKLLIPERINLIEEENDFLLTIRDKVAKELNSKCCKKSQNLEL